MAEMHVLGYTLFKDPSIKWTMLVVDPPANARVSATPFTTVNRTDALSSALIRASGMTLGGELLVEGCDACGGGDGNCTSDSEGNHCCATCAGETCPLSSINSILSTTNTSLGLSVAYTFRDNFLAKSAVGRKYISYYYIIGKVALENNAITKENINRYISFSIKAYECARKIQYSDNNTIIYDKDFQEQALSFLNEYHSFSDDKSYQEALDTIEHDLNLFTGKTKDYILSNWE